MAAYVLVEGESLGELQGRFPRWPLVSKINPEVERYGAKRAGATVLELADASHAVAVSRPKEVAGLIRDAVRATS